jgi:hypothetical protein
VTLAVPLIIAGHLGIVERLQGKGIWYGFIGAVAGIFGAFILAVDKGSLCLVLPHSTPYRMLSLPNWCRRYR